MTIYLIQIVFVFVLSLIYKTKSVINNNKRKTIYLLLVCSMLFLTMGLRGVKIGSDTQTYRWIYESIMNSSSFFEALNRSTISSAPVYVFIQFVISRITNFKQLSILVNSFIIVAGLYRFIKLSSKEYCLSMFLFIGLALYYESMNGSRQFMAIAIALNSYLYIKQDIKSKKGWALFAIAVGIHNTILAFVLPLLSNLLKNKVRTTQKALSLTFAFALFVTLGLSAGISMFEYIFPSYAMYINGENGAQITVSTGNGRIALLFVFIGLLILTLLYLCKQKSKQHRIDFVDCFTCFLCVLLGIIYSKNVLIIRIIWPFLCVCIVYIPNLIVMLGTKNKRIVSFTTIFVLLIYSVLFLLEDKSGIVPYIPFWL